MSGGHFNYIQHSIDDAAEEVRGTAERYAKTCTGQTISRLNEAADLLERAAKMLNRIDYFIEGDDGEESFNRRWEEDGI